MGMRKKHNQVKQSFCNKSFLETLFWMSASEIKKMCKKHGIPYSYAENSELQIPIKDTMKLCDIYFGPTNIEDDTHE